MEASTAKDSINMQELEETVSRLSSHKGVNAVMILNREGNIVLSSGTSQATNDSSSATPPAQAKFIKQLMEVATKYIHCMDPNDVVSFVQIRSKQHEVMLAPHNDYILAVLQDPLVASPST